MGSSSIGHWVLYVTVCLYSLAYMAQVPLLPYLLNELGQKGTTSYGRLSTVFSGAQLVGGLLAGPLADRYGGRVLMLLSLASSVLSYGLTASARSMTGLYLSRVFTLMQHAILAARSYIAATAPPDARARMLGMLGTAYGVGFAVGPALGGVLSQWGLRATAWVATAASLGSLLAVAVLVPGGQQARTLDMKVIQGIRKEGTSQAAPGPQSQTETTGKSALTTQAPLTEGPSSSGSVQAGTTVASQHSTHTVRQGSSWWRSVAQPVQVLRYPAVRQLMAVKLATGLAGALLQSVFSLMLQREYELSSQHNGLVLSYVGLLTMISQAGLVEKARRTLGEGGAVQASCMLAAVGYATLALSHKSVTLLLVSLVPNAVGASVLSTVTTSQLTRAAPSEVVGSVLALDMTLFAGVRILTPGVGTVLLDRGGVALVGGVATALVVGLLGVAQLGLVRWDGGLPPLSIHSSQPTMQAKKHQ